MKKTAMLNIRISTDTKTNLEREAKFQEVTLAELVREKLSLSTTFVKPIEKFIVWWSKRIGIDRHLFVECLIVDYMAMVSARSKVSTSTKRLLPMFRYDSEGLLLRGKELFDFLKQSYINEMEGELMSDK